MKCFIYRLWRMTLVAVFLLIAASCSRDLSHDPEAVDAITIDYLQNDFRADVEAAEGVRVVEKVTLTRQDYVPIAIVSYSTDNQSYRDFYAFCYDDLCKVRDVVESKGEQCSYEDICAALGCALWQPHAAAMKSIILRAKRGQLPER